MGTVYLIVNDVNKKVYVGVTTQANWEHRMYEHVHRFNRGDRNHKLYQAMKKHGIENFRMFPICSVLSNFWLPFFEKHFISECDSFNHGYNMTPGGETVSEETRAKISAKLTDRKITWYDKILESRLANPDRKHPRDYTPKGADNALSVSYTVRFPSGRVETFKGLRAFCRQYGLSHNLMLAVLKGWQTHHKGFVLLSKSNDYPDREYTQASGSGAHPISADYSDFQ